MTKVQITQDLRRDDGTGWQVGEVDGWQVAREFVRPLESFDSEAGSFTYAPGPAIPGPWCYNVTGFTTRPDWPEHPSMMAIADMSRAAMAARSPCASLAARSS